MNNEITQPLTDADVAAVVTQLQSSSSSNAKTAMLKMIVTVASQAQDMKISSADVFNALAAGSTNFADTALYEALALESTMLTSWGALIIQGAGVVQVISWAKSAPAWLAAQVKTLENVVVDAVAGNFKSAGSALMSVFGIGTTVQKDAASMNQMFTLLASSQAPTFAAVLQSLSSNKAVSVTPSSSSASASSSTSASGSTSGSASVSGSGSGSGSMDMKSVGIRSRKSLVRTRR